VSDLRGPLVKALEDLADDLAIERYGDPHVAFVVFVTADGPPRIASVTHRGRHDMATLVDGNSPLASKKTELFFGAADIVEAGLALGDAANALRYPRRKNTDQSIGEYVSGEVERIWRYRRDAEVERSMTAAARESMPKCPHCKGRFKTDRGLKMHLARAPYCAAIEARAR
jgi:hypothetical protein